jgi:hypothetical protein
MEKRNLVIYWLATALMSVGMLGSGIKPGITGQRNGGNFNTPGLPGLFYDDHRRLESAWCYGYFTSGIEIG